MSSLPTRFVATRKNWFSMALARDRIFQCESLGSGKAAGKSINPAPFRAYVRYSSGKRMS
jgi:hypothetical protein